MSTLLFELEAPKVPAGHPVPPAGSVAASKCPFLAAEMGQKNSSVVRQASMALQEDVSEVRTMRKGSCFNLGSVEVYCSLEH